MWEFPGGLVVRIPGFHCLGLGSIPGGGKVRSRQPHGVAKKEKKKIEVIEDCLKKIKK